MEAVLYARNPPGVWGWDCSAGWQQPELATPFAACNARGSKITYWRIFPDWPMMKNPDSYGLGNWELYTKKFSSTCCFFIIFWGWRKSFTLGTPSFPVTWQVLSDFWCNNKIPGLWRDELKPSFHISTPSGLRTETQLSVSWLFRFGKSKWKRKLRRHPKFWLPSIGTWTSVFISQVHHRMSLTLDSISI